MSKAKADSFSADCRFMQLISDRCVTENCFSFGLIFFPLTSLTDP